MSRPAGSAEGGGPKYSGNAGPGSKPSQSRSGGGSSRNRSPSPNKDGNKLKDGYTISDPKTGEYSNYEYKDGKGTKISGGQSNVYKRDNTYMPSAPQPANTPPGYREPEVLTRAELNAISNPQSRDVTSKPTIKYVGKGPNGTAGVEDSVAQQSYLIKGNEQTVKNIEAYRQVEADRASIYARRNNTINKQDNNNSNNSIYSSNTNVVAKKEKTKLFTLGNYEERVNTLNKNEAAFYNYEGFGRVRDFSNIITFGRGTPYEYRSGVGKVAENVVYGVTSMPEYIAGSIWFGSQKTVATVEALKYKETRGNVAPVLLSTAKEAIIQTAKSLPPTNPENIANDIIILGAAGLGYGKAKGSPVVQTGMKILRPGKFVKAESSGVIFVEDYTVETGLKELRSFEGKQEVPTAHVTVSNPFDAKGEFVTKANPTEAGGLRQSAGLYNFYKSSPEILSNGELKPRAYLAYAGVGGGIYNEVKPIPIRGNPDINVLLFKDQITKTPSVVSSKSIRDVNSWQIEQSGKTFVPAENIKGASVEGQVVTPSAYENVPGYSNTQGSLIKKTGNEKFTYYTQKLNNPFSDPVSRKLWDAFGEKKRVVKINLIEAETKPVEGALKPKSNVVDINKYNKEYYTQKRYITSSSPAISNINIARSSPVYTVKSINPSYIKSVASPYYSISSLNSRSISQSASKSPSKSMSVSPNKSPSRSPSPSRSRFPSPNRSPSLSPSPSPIRSISPSPSPSPSKSPSPSPSPSPSKSPSPSPSPSPSVTTSFKPSPPVKKKPNEIKKAKSKKYSVEVRRNGQFKAVAMTEDLSFAFRAGEERVKNTPAASFRVKDLSSGGSVSSIADNVPRQQYYESKKEPGVFIQKNRHRIGTVGEKREITSRGIMSSRARRSRGSAISKMFGGR